MLVAYAENWRFASMLSRRKMYRKPLTMDQFDRENGVPPWIGRRVNGEREDPKLEARSSLATA
jgi:hypothetical protein